MLRWGESLAVACIFCTAAVFSAVPDATSATYHGLIREDAPAGTEVELDIPILARDKTPLGGDDVCGYTVYKSHSELPFKVMLQDKMSGRARVVLAPGYKLDYERRHKYTFEIAPHDCLTGKHAARETVHIEVEDVNEYAPAPEQDSFMVDVVELKLFDEILRLRAPDRDGSVGYKTICHYHILTPDVPFRIDNEGVLYNTEPLDYSRKHNYILEVKIEDCGGRDSRSSNKVMVNIRVTQACKNGWKGISERIDYAPGSNTKLLGEKASLDTCDATCSEKEVSARIQLTTKHIGKGCDRDTYSIQSQRKLCGASTGIVDLLPPPSTHDWTKPLPTDDGKEQDQIFSFDGKTTAIEVPASRFNHSLDSHFTIMTWMKHEPEASTTGHHGPKEHILCNSDGEKMSRHHYSLFVHNCRLILLFRQEPEGNDLNIFKPAEWRWKVPQICDGQWHHYAISVDFPQQVRLYIDGRLFVAAKHNPEIIDDWPLHPSKKIHFTKLVVGACWQGGEGGLAQYFSGYLAGLSFLQGKTESDRVIRCLNDCKEKLDFHAMNEMESGMSVAFNSEMTEITINGKNRSEVEKLVRRVGYINTRMFPTPGHRALTINTDITCEDNRKVSVPEVDSLIVVLQAEHPIISITGTSNIAEAESEFLNGKFLFRDVSIDAQTRKEAEEVEEQPTEQNAAYTQAVANDRYRLDACIIRANPPLTLDTEHLKWPVHLMGQLGLEATQTEDGLIISGADKVFNYQEVLRQVQYVNRRPEDMNNREFVLTCSELNGRFVSNQFVVKTDVIHTVHHASVPQAHIDSKVKVEPLQKYSKGIHLQDQNMVAQKGATGIGVTVIVVVCVGFLIFMIVLGVIRIRAAHQRTQVVTVDERAEMEWDNAGLTITVNPMDTEAGGTVEPSYGENFTQTMYEDEQEMAGLRDDSDTDDDDISEDFHDDIESSEEEAEKVKDRELEWDDSTLSF